MALNNTLAANLNSSNATYELVGWNPSDNSRGSIEILWSCCVTIILCCWVSTFPNIPSQNDKWYHAHVDRFNLACLGLIGPDYVFAIALGQLSSAWRSVKLFRGLSRFPQSRKWSLVHGFFADMGGFVLVSPDCPSFPVNAEQLHYLVNHGHVDFPNISKAEIKALSKTDGLSKLIVLWQVFWFSLSELQRVKEGLPMTTFELTALSFSLTMFITSLCWYAKPTITSPSPTMIYTKDGRSIESIRAVARETTHPGLPATWYRTPLDFISPHRRFRVDVHFSYYLQISYMMRLPVVSRPMNLTPWDRLPSESFLFIDRALLAPAFVVAAAFSLSPLAAWNFHFPTQAERIGWRVCSVYHAVYSLSLAVYYVYAALQEDKGTAAAAAGRSECRPPASCSPEIQQQQDESDGNRPGKMTICYDVEAGSVSREQRRVGVQGLLQDSLDWLRSWRNISPDGDPDMAMGLHATIPPLIGNVLYLVCRVFFYIEDFISIRQQPAGVYKSMNKFVPFLS